MRGLLLALLVAKLRVGDLDGDPRRAAAAVEALAAVDRGGAPPWPAATGDVSRGLERQARRWWEARGAQAARRAELVHWDRLSAALAERADQVDDLGSLEPRLRSELGWLAQEHPALRRAWDIDALALALHAPDATLDAVLEGPRATLLGALRRAQAQEQARRAALITALAAVEPGPWTALVRAETLLAAAEDRSTEAVVAWQAGLGPEPPRFDHGDALPAFRQVALRWPSAPEAAVAQARLAEVEALSAPPGPEPVLDADLPQALQVLWERAAAAPARTGPDPTLPPPELLRAGAVLAHQTVDAPQLVAACLAAGGDPRWARQALTLASSDLARQARHEDAIALLREVATRWPTNPDLPALLYQAARLHMALPVPDRVGAEQALTDLVTLTAPDSAWSAANGSDPEALSLARHRGREALAVVATNRHRAADQASPAEAPALWAAAAADYDLYLSRYPDAADAAELQTYLGTTQANLGQWAAAEQTFQAILSRGTTAYADMALWQLMQAQRQQLLGRYGAVETLPPDATVERRVTLPSGKERPIYTLGPLHARFIATCDALVTATFVDPDYAAALDQYRPALAYLPAQILYNHGRFDEARPRFEEVIRRWPETDEAAFSARLIVDSYSDEENLEWFRTHIHHVTGPY